MTAVEWFAEQMIVNGKLTPELFKQAKEMEKEISRKMYEHAMFALVDGNGHGETFDEYWNRTFKN